MSNLPLKFGQYIVPLLIVCTSIVLYFMEPYSSQYLEYNVPAIQLGEHYRLLSGHLLHTNLIHLLFNVLGFILLWALHGDDYRPLECSLLFIGLCLCVSLMMYFLSSELTSYVGLSGVLHGIFAWGIVQDIRKKMLSGYLLLIGLVLKVGNEQLYGAGTLMPDLIGASVAIQSHLYGAIMGVLFGILSWIFRTKHTST